MARSVLVGPQVADAATLSSLLARLGHYFDGVGIRRITIALGPTLDEATAVELLRAPSLPCGMHPDVLARLAGVAQAIRFVDHRELGEAVAGADVMLLFDERARDSTPWSGILAGYRSNRTSFEVDWMRTRVDGIAFADAARLVGSRTRRFDANSTAHFRYATQHLLGAPDALLVGTGPSARDVLRTDAAEGVRIVCNTVVLDDELIDHVRPQFVTCADPVFHFGPSSYSYRFRDALVRQARRLDFLVVTVERYAPLLRSLCPALARRVIGVRLGSPGWPQNLDLHHALAVRPYQNVLTMLMLPLGATFAKRIHLIGFDGRDPNETYFWRHGASVQLEDAIGDVMASHPGFFDLDYADYYRQHVNAVEHVVAAFEAQGGEVVSRAASRIPALARRVDASPGPAVRRWLERGAADGADLVVSITPDWVGDFGHFGPWERALRRGAADVGTSVLTLASNALVTDDGSVVPAFTHGTLRGAADMEKFERELRDALAALTFGTRRVTVAFYTADLWHLPSLLAVARDHPEVTSVVNLMRVHAAVEASIAAADDPLPLPLVLLRDCLTAARDTNVVVCVDTEALADDIEALVRVRPAVWPMIVVGDADALDRAGRRQFRDHDSVHVVAAIQTQFGKGFREVVELAEHLSRKLKRGRIGLTTRFVQPPDRGLIEDQRRAVRFRKAGGRLVEGDLSDEQYAALIGSSDVVLLPYHVDTFRTRTSAVFLDAVAAGKPVVVPRGTWAANQVERFGIGITYRGHERRGMDKAVGAAIRRLDELTIAVRRQREKVLEEFAPHRLVDFLLEARPSCATTPDTGSLRRAEELLAAVVTDSQRAAGEWRRTEVDHEVAVDDVRRAHDDTLDRLERQRRTTVRLEALVESMRAAVQWRQSRIDRLESRPRLAIGGAPRQPSPRVQRLRKSLRRTGGRNLRRVGIDPVVVKQRWPWIDRL